jgi:hypothetical protein
LQEDRGAGATGLEPATSGVTGRSWRFRAERGWAGIPAESKAFGLERCGDLRGCAGASGNLLRDERGMRGCPCGEQSGMALDRVAFAATGVKRAEQVRRRPPPYHALLPATGRNRWQRFPRVRAIFSAFPFATSCHWLRPLCSINAPFAVAYEDNGSRVSTPSLLERSSTGAPGCVVILSRFMGSIIAMIDRHYGQLARDSREHAVSLLDALALERAVDAGWTSPGAPATTLTNRVSKPRRTRLPKPVDVRWTSKPARSVKSGNRNSARAG